jgi:hypothetical protein
MALCALLCVRFNLCKSDTVCEVDTLLACHEDALSVLSCFHACGCCVLQNAMPSAMACVRWHECGGMCCRDVCAGQQSAFILFGILSLQLALIISCHKKGG